MVIKELADVNRLIAQLMSEELLFDRLDFDCGISNESLLDIKCKKNTSKNLVSQLELRLLFLKSLISNDKELLNPVSYDKTAASQSKELCDNLREKIDGLIPELTQKFFNLDEKLKILAEKVSLVTYKAEQHRKLKLEKVDKIQEIFGPHLPNDDFCLDKDLISKIETAKAVYQKGKENVSQLQEKLENLKTSCKEISDTLAEKENLHRKEKQELDKELNLTQQICELYESFTDVKLSKCDKNSVQIELREPQEGKSLFVTFIFHQHKNGTVMVSDVQVQHCDLYISDCVEHVLKLQSLPSCVKNIVDRWHYYSSLKDQITDLQNRLPVDWIQHQNKVRVVVGKNANIICTLQLPLVDQPRITLLAVRGGNVKLKNKIMPANENASINEWIEYLEGYFG